MAFLVIALYLLLKKIVMKIERKTNSQVRTEKEKLVMENFASVMNKLDATFLIEGHENRLIKVGDTVSIIGSDRQWTITMFDKPDDSQFIDIKTENPRTLFSARVVGEPITMNGGTLDTSSEEFDVSMIDTSKTVR